MKMRCKIVAYGNNVWCARVCIICFCLEFVHDTYISCKAKILLKWKYCTPPPNPPQKAIKAMQNNLSFIMKITLSRRALKVLMKQTYNCFPLMINWNAEEIWKCLHHHTKRQYSNSEFVFHILSTGWVMTPVIKAGNCLTAVQRYWIPGLFCRHNQRQLDVKSLSSEIGSRAEQTHKRCYQHQREMQALCCLTFANGTQPTCYLILPRDSHCLCPPASCNQTQSLL